MTLTTLPAVLEQFVHRNDRPAVLRFLNAVLEGGVAREGYSFDNADGEMEFVQIEPVHKAQLPDILIIPTGDT